MASHDRFVARPPRALRDPDALRARLQAVRTEPTALPLNDWVEKLRGRLGGGESVPRFDPASGGIEARSLFRKKLRVGAAQGLLGVRRPVVDEARSAPVWQRVEVLSGAYEVAP